LFDAGRGPYSILIDTFVFFAYFTTVVFADAVRGQEVWSYLTSIGAFPVALGAPILGAIADAGGRRKPRLLACVILGAPCKAALWYASPGMPPGFSWVFLAGAVQLRARHLRRPAGRLARYAHWLAAGGDGASPCWSRADW
jgi:UMF1 family MFS transporter